MEEFKIEHLTEERKEEWLQHVDEVFENTPREYFERHLNNDHNAKLEHIFIAIDNKSGNIASTVRVVLRKINFFHQNKHHSLSFGGEEKGFHDFKMVHFTANILFFCI